MNRSSSKMYIIYYYNVIHLLDTQIAKYFFA